MKKLLIITLVLLASTVFAMEKAAVVTVLNSSTYTAITAAENCPYGYTRWVEDETGYYYSTSADGSNPVEMLLRGAISFPDSVTKGEIVIYVKAKTGTPNFILQPARAGR